MTQCLQRTIRSNRPNSTSRKGIYLCVHIIWIAVVWPSNQIQLTRNLPHLCNYKIPNSHSNIQSFWTELIGTNLSIGVQSRLHLFLAWSQIYSHFTTISCFYYLFSITNIKSFNSTSTFNGGMLLGQTLTVRCGVNSKFC